MTPDQQQQIRKAFQVAGPKVRRLLKPLAEKTVVNLNGAELLIDPRDNFTEFMIWANDTFPEPESLNSLLGMVEGKKTLFLDIGANCGAYTVPIALAAGEGSKVVAFEPNPVMISRLGENIRRNDLGAKVLIQGCALGAEEGEALLMLKRGNFGEASLLHVSPRRHVGSINVPVRPLTPFLVQADEFEATIIKIDVEGYEASVLMPWLAVSSEYSKPDAILIETEHKDKWPTDLVGEIENAGYVAQFEGEGNTLFVLKEARHV